MWGKPSLLNIIGHLNPNTCKWSTHMHTHLLFWYWDCGPKADFQPSGLCGRCCGNGRNKLQQQSAWTSSWHPFLPYGHEPLNGLQVQSQRWCILIIIHEINRKDWLTFNPFNDFFTPGVKLTVEREKIITTKTFWVFQKGVPYQISPHRWHILWPDRSFSPFPSPENTKKMKKKDP